ncbi:MAG: hypothetical protein II771_05955 [Clostridia bacterium]|nr:hypothetical protein [Clostridia bacterium]
MATFFNQATLSYRGSVLASNVATGEIVETLSANKTAVTEEYTRGTAITYALNILNSGAAPFAGLTVTDDLGAYAFGDVTLTPLDYEEGSVKLFVNGVLQASPAVTAGPPLVFSGISVPANGVATLLYTAHANEFAPPTEGSSITNTAVVSGGGLTSVTVSAAVPAATEPALSILKSISPASVPENGQVTYTFELRNAGGAATVQTDEVSVTDTFDPLLSDLTVTVDGTARTAPADYTYNEASGLFRTVSGTLTVPAASYTQDPVTGAWSTVPGVTVLTVTGTI